MYRGVSVQSLAAPRNYGLGIFLLCSCYLLFQILYIPYLWLGIDELWFAHHIYQYTQSLPYRDFIPYKTVLGYYVLSLPFYFSHGVLQPLFLIKDEMAVINVLMIFLVSQWARRWFNPQAVFYTVLIIMVGQFFLIYATELRVDMMTSWLCLIAAMLVLSQWVGLAGIVLGLAFLVSQKALWYVLAMEAALLLTSYICLSNAQTARRFLIFNVSLILTIGLYILFWAHYAGLHTVLHSMFYEAYTQAKINYYASSYLRFWQIIINNGPLPVLLLPLTFLVLLDVDTLDPAAKMRRVFIMLFGGFSLFLMASYQQFFPYNSVFLLPAFFLMYGEFFSWVLTRGKPELSLSQRQLFGYVTLCVLLDLIILIGLGIPRIYVLLLLVPPLLFYFCTVTKTRGGMWLFGIVVLITGIYAPLAFFTMTAYKLDGGYQQQNIMLANELAQPGDSYIAGTFILYDKDQTVPGFKNLIAPALRFANSGDTSLLPILIDSLSITPMTAPELLANLQKYPVKFIVNNYRIGGLPPSVLKVIGAEYQHYWGGIDLYAPTVLAGQQQLQLKFTGHYLVESQGLVVIDHLQFAKDALVPLHKGLHQVSSDAGFRLKYTPAVTLQLKEEYEHDCASCFVKPVAY
jgi:hypothetical protein